MKQVIAIITIIIMNGCAFFSPFILNKQSKEIEAWSKQLKSDTLAVIQLKADTIHYFKKMNLASNYSMTSGEYHYSNGLIIDIKVLIRRDSVISAKIQPRPYILKLGTSFQTQSIWEKHGFGIAKEGYLPGIEFRKTNSYLVDSVYSKEIYDSDFENHLSAFGVNSVFTPGGENIGRGFYESKNYLGNILDSAEVKLLMKSINPIGRIMGYSLSMKYKSLDFENLRNRLDWDTTKVSILNGCLGSEAELFRLVQNLDKN